MSQPFGRYTLTGFLAAGGMADVYRAEVAGEAGFHKELAIKIIRGDFGDRPEFVEMFKQEARIASRLNHSHLVHVFDFGQVDGRWYIAMELVRGKTLGEVAARARAVGRRLELPLVLQLGSQVAAALAYVHRLEVEGRPLGLVHRDVSPQNVLLSFEGEVKLADFGIARAVNVGPALTTPGTIKGKLAYMAPEQARGQDVDPRVDVFALGVVLWELCCGFNPFDRETLAATLLALTGTEPLDPPSRWNDRVPPALDEAILAALQRDRERRTRTAQELEQQLREVLFSLARKPSDVDLRAFMHALWPEGTASVPAGGTAVQDTPTPRGPPPEAPGQPAASTDPPPRKVTRRRRRRDRTIAVAVAASFLGAAVAAGLFFAMSRRAAPVGAPGGAPASAATEGVTSGRPGSSGDAASAQPSAAGGPAGAGEVPEADVRRLREAVRAVLRSGAASGEGTEPSGEVARGQQQPDSAPGAGSRPEPAPLPERTIEVHLRGPAPGVRLIAWSEEPARRYVTPLNQAIPPVGSTGFGPFWRLPQGSFKDGMIHFGFVLWSHVDPGNPARSVVAMMGDRTCGPISWSAARSRVVWVDDLCRPQATEGEASKAAGEGKRGAEPDVQRLIVGRWKEIGDNPEVMTFQKDGKLRLETEGAALNGTYRFLDDRRYRADIEGISALAGPVVMTVVAIGRDEATIATPDGHAARYQRIE